MVKANVSGEFVFAALFCGVEPIRQEYIAGCERSGIPYRYIAKKSGLDLKVYRNVLQAFGEQKPDLIFLHGSSFILPAFLYKLLRPKTKIFVRDSQAYHLKTKMDWVWLFLACHLSDKIIFLTKEAAFQTKKKFKGLVPAGKIHIIGNGLELGDYTVAGSIPGKEPFVIGMQSRLQKIKDHTTLLRAFAQVTQQLPHLPLLLRIAGDGETREELVRLTASLGLSGKVEFTGMLDKANLDAFMKSLNLYVHASFGETMSTSVMQAMAYGLPVIGSDVFGISNMIIHQENGLLYESQNTEALARLMAELITDVEKRSRLALNARQYAEEHFSNLTMYNRYKKLMLETQRGTVAPGQPITGKEMMK